jgi:hypothetical protein
MSDVEAELDLARLSEGVAGLVVAEVTRPTQDTLGVRFENGSVLVFGATKNGVSVALKRRDVERRTSGRPQPTRRQREYLQFIKKYMHRFGVPPAESDIERHFLVSAPSINQMIRTLERRGFIERDRDWRTGQAAPRSIRVLWEE